MAIYVRVHSESLNLTNRVTEDEWIEALDILNKLDPTSTIYFLTGNATVKDLYNAEVIRNPSPEHAKVYSFLAKESENISERIKSYWKMRNMTFTGPAPKGMPDVSQFIKPANFLPMLAPAAAPEPIRKNRKKKLTRSPEV